MRRTLLALIVGGVIAAAVYGSSATLGGIGNPDLGAEDAAVPSCDTDGVETAYSVGFDGGIRVTQVKVTKIADACRGNVVDVFLTKDGAQLGTGTAPVQNGPSDDNFADVPLGLSGPLARDVNDIHISIR